MRAIEIHFLIATGLSGNQNYHPREYDHATAQVSPRTSGVSLHNLTAPIGYLFRSHKLVESGVAESTLVEHFGNNILQILTTSVER